METFKKLNQVNKDVWFLLIFITAVFLYLFNINFSDLWIDEAFTKALMKLSLGDITRLIKNDYHPPLYFYGLKIFVSIFGINDFTLRLFSVLGALATLVLGYLTGQRIFEKSGALYFCLLLLSLPMMVSFSHEARMYTWGAFSVTGVYFYSVLFIKTNKRKDLILLMLFSLLSAYTHYYALLAAFGANIYVLLFLLVKQNKSWKIHFLYSIIAVLLFMPWLSAFLGQFRAVQKSFWVPELNWSIILACFTSPFAHKIWLPPSLTMIIIFYGLTIWVIYRNYIARNDRQGTILTLAIVIFAVPFLTALIISLFSHSILYTRYIANIAVMLIVPPTLFFITFKNKWVKIILITVILVFSLTLSYKASFFSYGPYRQSVEYLHEKYPGVKKVFHVIEISAGPFVEYNNFGIDNYWYKTNSTVVFTNMDVFTSLKVTGSIGKVLKNDEQFCAVSFPFLALNENNLRQILSESQVIKVDTVIDKKVEYGGSLLLYICKYKGYN